MKSHIVKNILTGLLLFAIISAVLALASPLYRYFSDRIDTFKDFFLDDIADKTGLDISFASLSPSIFNSLSVKNIILSDKSTNMPVARIKNAFVKYSLYSFIQNKPDRAVSLITLDGVDIMYDTAKNSTVFSKLSSFADAAAAEGSEEPFVLMFPVKMRNVSLSFASPEFSSAILLSQLFLRADAAGQQLLIETSGSITFDPSEGVKKSFAQDIGRAECSFSLKAALAPGFDGSSVRLRINHLSNDNYSFIPMQLILEYDDNKADIRLIQKVAGMSAECTVFLPKTDAETNDVFVNKFLTASVTARSLDPFSLVRISDKKNPLNMFRGVLLNGTYSVTADKEFSSVYYTASGSSRLPSALLPEWISGPAQSSFEVSGSLSSLLCRSLSLKTRDIDVSAAGSFNIKTLQPEGIVTLRSWMLPNGNTVKNIELYLEPFQNGIFALIPSADIGDVPYNAVQIHVLPSYSGTKISSIDFTSEFITYDHIDAENAGSVSVSGSFITSKIDQIQAEIEIENLYFDTILKSAAFFVDKETSESLFTAAEKTTPYVMSSMIYVNTDFSGVSFNIPYAIAANTLKDKEVVVLSVDGNERSVRVSQFDALYFGQSAAGSFTIDFSPDYRDILFGASIQINTIPYDFSGTFTAGRHLYMSGSSGLEIDAAFGGEKIAEGRLSMQSLPAAFDKYVVSLSAAATFSVESASVWNASFMQLEISEPSGNIPLQPSVSLTGSIDRYGCMVHSMQYRDTVSNLTGSVFVNWKYVSEIPENAEISLSLADPVGSESYGVKVQLSNPNRKKAAQLDIFQDIFFTAEADVSKTPLQRFDNGQKKENNASFLLSALGTLRNPGGSIVVPSLIYRAGSSDAVFSGTIGMDDAVLTLTGGEVTYDTHTLSELEAVFDLSSFNGNAAFAYEGVFGDESVTTPAEIYFLSEKNTDSKKNVQPDELNIFELDVPESYTVSAVIESITSPFLGKLPRLDIALSRIPGRFLFTAGQKKQAQGWITDSGQCRFVMSPDLPLSFEASGLIDHGGIDVSLEKFRLTADPFKKYIRFPFFILHEAEITGSAHIGGLLSDPEFSCDLTARGVQAASPDFSAERFKAVPFSISAKENVIFFEKAQLSALSGIGTVFVSLALNLDRWFFDSLDVKIEVPRNKMIKGRFSLPYMQFEGDAAVDLDIAVRLDSVFASGTVYADNAAGIFFPIAETAAQLAAEPIPVDEDYRVNADIKIMVGNHAQVFSPSKTSPIVRALVNPQTPISVRIDTAEDLFELKGDLVLRGGEIKYFSRTFYLREGRLELNENTDKFDPVITVRAEMRERDDSGEMIRIILGVQKQSLSNLNPVFTSTPARSENEIMELLGQGFTDSLGSENLGFQLIASAVDLAGQFAIFRQVETRLREVSNFDIFSLQTSILQNAMLSYLESVSGDTNTLTAGNFFDNTAVYMGKYFGNSLYFDALLHLSYDENKEKKENKDDWFSGFEALVFQPEIGLEMASPFAAIRWSLAPELGADTNDWTKNLLVSSASISLSWKFSF